MSAPAGQSAEVLPFPGPSTRNRIYLRSSSTRGCEDCLSTRPARHPMVDLLLSFRSVMPLFEGVATDLINDIERMLDWVVIPSGATLFENGDAASDAFVVISGELGVLSGPQADQRVIAKCGAGELIGESALISNTARETTAVALRDSQLIRLPRSIIDLLAENSPQAVRFLFGLLRLQLQSTSSPSPMTRLSQTLALIPLGAARIAGMAGWLSHLTQPVVASDEAQENLLRNRSMASGRSLLYIADDPSSAWARHCIRRADRVIFVAQARSAVAGREIIAFAKDLHRDSTLVLVNPPNASAPGEGTAWRSLFNVDHVLHVREGNTSDYGRMLRLVSRKGLCLVLSGGGARAFSHIGVVKAFEEYGLPIDAVGGTSMGAIIAALIAQDVSADGILERMRRHFVSSNPLSDYTIPLVSMVRGRKLSKVFRESFGDAAVENLWLPFFCISADLAKGVAVAHRDGLLWQALRSSTAIPGIIPPVLVNGQVLVDGGIVDNFPTPLMRSLQRGTVVGVDVSPETSISSADVLLEDKSVLWLLLHGRRQVPSIDRILVRSATMGTRSQIATARAAADVLIQPNVEGVNMLSFKSLDRAVEAGYRAAVETIKSLEPPCDPAAPAWRAAA
jgi:NTE family protein